MGFRQAEKNKKQEKTGNKRKNNLRRNSLLRSGSSESVARINATTVRENDHQTLTSSASIDYSLRVQKLQGCKNIWTTTYSQKSQGLRPILLHGKRIMSNLVPSLCFQAKSTGQCRFCVSSSLFPLWQSGIKQFMVAPYSWQINGGALGSLGSLGT